MIASILWLQSARNFFLNDVISSCCNTDKDVALWPAGTDWSAFLSVVLLFPHVTKHVTREGCGDFGNVF